MKESYKCYYTEETFCSILSKMADVDAPDLYFVVGNSPIMKDKRDGSLYQIGRWFEKEYPQLTPEDTENIASYLLREGKKDFEEKNEVDMNWELLGKARFRINISRSFGHYTIAIRKIPLQIPKITDLGFSPEVVERLNRVCSYKDGLILVTGPTGSGKSTTLAAMIGEMRRKGSRSIITIEDPIEFVHPHSDSDVIIQQEVGIDTESYYDGLRSALRKRPNIILIGEIRGREIEEVIMAANTGHMVLSTLHTRSAAQTIERIVTLRQGISKQDAYKEVAEVMKAFIAQQLVQRADGAGSVPVCEILANTPYVAEIIARGADFMELKEALEGKTRSEEIISLNTDLFNRWQRKEITREEALAVSYNPTDLDLKMRRFGGLDFDVKEKKREEEESGLFKGFE